MITLLLSLLLTQEAVEFRGTGWVNSKELRLENLRGKVVVLYFYEEG